MNESEMREIDAALLRARLHLRAFWTLMRHKKFAHGICALYDSLESAFHWFILSHDQISYVPSQYIHSASQAYKILIESGLVKLDFDIESFENLLTRALKYDFDDKNPDFDFEKLWRDIEKVFHELGILPFDLDSLPKENEATRKIMGL